jgi:hypothetical protein
MLASGHSALSTLNHSYVPNTKTHWWSHPDPNNMLVISGITILQGKNPYVPTTGNHNCWLDIRILDFCTLNSHGKGLTANQTIVKPYLNDVECV